MSMPSLDNTKVLVVVFAMNGCPACGDFLPKFTKAIDAAQKRGEPFVVWQPNQAIAPGQIPVLVYDAGSEAPDLQAFADKLGVVGVPATYVLTRNGTLKAEGTMGQREIAAMLKSAVAANR